METPKTAVVPVEPTEAMLVAAHDAECDVGEIALDTAELKAIYAAMLAAAPEAPTDSAVLKPCPLCGAEAEDRSHPSCDCCGKSFNGAVGCRVCPAEVSHLDSAAAALSAWNRRAQPASQVSEMREKVARIIVGPMCDSTKEDHVIMREGRYAFCTKCGETITKSAMSLFDARNRADAILAILNTSREGGSGPLQPQEAASVPGAATADSEANREGAGG